MVRRYLAAIELFYDGRAGHVVVGDTGLVPTGRCTCPLTARLRAAGSRCTSRTHSGRLVLLTQPVVLGAVSGRRVAHA